MLPVYDRARRAGIVRERKNRVYYISVGYPGVHCYTYCYCAHRNPLCAAAEAENMNPIIALPQCMPKTPRQAQYDPGANLRNRFRSYSPGSGAAGGSGADAHVHTDRIDFEW